MGEFSYPSAGYFFRKGVLLGHANGPIGNLIEQPWRRAWSTCL